MATQVHLIATPFASDACVGEAQPIQIVLTVPGEAINAAQGMLRFDPTQLKVESVSTSRSVFRFWQTSPTVDAVRGTVVFAGGLPTPGYTGTGGVLFAVNAVPLKVGSDVRLTWDAATTVLLNDGQGTEASLAMQDARLSVSEASSVICTGERTTAVPVTDTTSPEPFDVVITRTENAFQNKYFASYYAYDSGSGIVRYEVRENGSAWAEHTSPYLLKQQSGQVLLEVKAVDAAGNFRIASSSHMLESGFSFSWGPWWFWLMAGILIVVTVTRILMERRRKNDLVVAEREPAGAHICPPPTDNHEHK